MTTIESEGLSQFIDGWARGANVPREAAVLKVVSTLHDLDKWTSETCDHTYDEVVTSANVQCPFAVWVNFPTSFDKKCMFSVGKDGCKLPEITREGKLMKKLEEL